MTASVPSVSDPDVVPRRAARDGGMREEPEGRRSGLTMAAGRIVLVVAICALWEWIAVTTGAEFWISRPTLVFEQLGEWIGNGYLATHIGITLQEMLLGFLLGASVGIAVGFILGLTPVLGRLLDPFITAVYSLPKIALAPLFVLWFGVGLSMKVILTAVIVFFLVFWNTYTGVLERNRELVDVLSVMGARRRHIIRKVVLPGALTYIYVGLKLAIPYALIGAVVGEIIASNRGIGYILMSAAGAFNTAGLFAALLVLTIISTILNEILNRSERYVLRWKRAGYKS
ncbi:ABC transporter permease [Actinophytocola sp.]|uniref:ABC transporter permease n=1 Tax=Actinophytocola sp. TaxID=1872138 RepID=UPI003D6ADA41